jgi:tRNA(Ile2) C34 agmatinyltransferase TiaS
MEQVNLKELKFNSRDEALSFLKNLWKEAGAECPICGDKLELLHRKAKKNDCDWQCRKCDKTYKTMHLMDELNETMPV